eukprot:scaffold2378_cov424-Prasinococcus_capsulatus_cf.AAC.2
MGLAEGRQLPIQSFFKPTNRRPTITDTSSLGVKRIRSTNSSKTDEVDHTPKLKKAAGAASVESSQRDRRSQQLFLDVGQKNFDHVTCKVCGLLYAKGQPSDERTHASHHSNYVHGVRFQVRSRSVTNSCPLCGQPEKLTGRLWPMQGWNDERLVSRDPSSGAKLVLVRPTDSHVHLRKVKEVVDTLNSHLGFAANWLDCEKLTVRAIA